ncbi:hypothetical protein E4U17_000049 [Claviceps sp. LM77 group G4]|nr:hypothetical protein E4U17_000049 [Claviceps sp. LM77 group G4]KAG6084505.1 hypothetical protein E4U16_001634 [Claviceps sp. LM84 group G4]KAG6086645.1 hypothetical protein E4U33_002321 [Claviceps sp. LM78 group G4]
MRAYSLLAFLLPLVAAKDHRQCACQSWSNDEEGWSHDRDLTQTVCKKDFYDVAKWDDHSGRCIVFPERKIDGTLWEGDCIQIGTVNGFRGFTTSGDQDMTTPVRKVIHAVGDCFHS